MIGRALGLEAGQRWEFGRWIGAGLAGMGLVGIAFGSNPLWLMLGMVGAGYALWRLA